MTLWQHNRRIADYARGNKHVSTLTCTKTKRGAPVRGEVESYTITTPKSLTMGCKANATKETSTVSHNFNFHQCGQHAGNGRTKISYKSHESQMKTSFEEHAHICMLTMFVTHENSIPCTRETKVHLPQRKGKTLTENSSALPVAALGRSGRF